jgi:hypothetical protein
LSALTGRDAGQAQRAPSSVIEPASAKLAGRLFKAMGDETSVRKLGGRVRITAQLIKALLECILGQTNSMAI